MILLTEFLYMNNHRDGRFRLPEGANSIWDNMNSEKIIEMI